MSVARQATPMFPGAADVRRALMVRSRDYGIVVALIVLCVVFAFATDAFLTVQNLRNLAQQSAEPGLLACGMTLVIIAGEFDLSVGAIFGFAGVVAAIVADAIGLLPAVLAGLAVGAGLGLVNGLIVSRGRIESFLVTLSTQFVFVGLAIYITKGSNNRPVTDIAGFGQLAHGTIATAQYTAWIGLLGFVACWLLLRCTGFGKQVHAIGGNLASARIAGVRIHVVRVSVFVMSGVLAAMAGVLAASDTGVAQADGGIGMEFTAITAVIIGGTSIAGGRGGVWRTLAGVLLVAVIGNGFTLLYINPTYNFLVQGAIILAAVVLDARLKGRARA
jgi:ribose transport system permease protein